MTTRTANPNTSRVIVALDFPGASDAIRLVSRLSPADCRLKVGFELFTAAGPEFVRSLTHDGYDVFLDLKFHDIPNTVVSACEAAAKLGVWMVNVHALGGRKMMVAAREALGSAEKRPLLIGVTLLTSHDEEELKDLGFSGTLDSEVTRLADLASRAGLDGVVCSAKEAPGLRTRFGRDFCLVTPGIRLDDSSRDDQARVVTPQAAVKNGADYLVIGRPITQASDPVAVLARINRELAVCHEQAASLTH